jgi:hypothetical protein
MEAHQLPTISNVAAGTYTVTVTEGGSCSATASVTVSAVEVDRWSNASAVANASCVAHDDR